MLVSRTSAVAGRRWARRFVLVLIVALCGSLSATASSSDASPGGLHILVTGTCFDEAVTPLAAAIQTLAGGATVTTFDTNAGTPTAAMLKSQNLVVSLGDSCGASPYGYADATTWGKSSSRTSRAVGPFSRPRMTTGIPPMRLRAASSPPAAMRRLDSG